MARRGGTLAPQLTTEKGQMMDDREKITRMIQSSLLLLRRSQGALTDRAPIRFSQAKYFEAVLRTLPYAVSGGRVLNRDYKPVGVAGYEERVDYDEWHTLTSDPAADFRLYSEIDAPWRSSADLNAYLRNLEALTVALSQGGGLTPDGTSSPTFLPDGDVWPSYRAYVEGLTKGLESAPSVVLALCGRDYNSAVATVHQVMGKGTVRTRRVDVRTFEVTALCN